MYRAILASLVLMFVVFTLVPAASAEKRVALVIGNLSYAEVATLPNPANDAKPCASKLR